MRTPTSIRVAERRGCGLLRYFLEGETYLTSAKRWCRLYLGIEFCSRPAFLQPPSHWEAGLCI
jgi:hypothetical protein